MGPREIVDVALVALLVYYVLRLIRGTRAVQMVVGIIVFALLYQLARYFGMATAEWLLGQVFAVFIVILVVVFQPEIRRGLVKVAINPLSASARAHELMARDLVGSAEALRQRGWGGLLVVERRANLKHLFESGVELAAPLSPDVALALFCPAAPLHDGAIVVATGEQGGVVRAARVVLPLAQADAVAGRFGTRHRAAVGLSEECDALVVVISEEERLIRVAENGRLSEPLTADALHAHLAERLITGRRS